MVTLIEENHPDSQRQRRHPAQPVRSGVAYSLRHM